MIQFAGVENFLAALSAQFQTRILRMHSLIVYAVPYTDIAQARIKEWRLYLFLDECIRITKKDTRNFSLSRLEPYGPLAYYEVDFSVFSAVVQQDLRSNLKTKIDFLPVEKRRIHGIS